MPSRTRIDDKTSMINQIGSTLIIDVADQADADAFANGDPFVEAGLFARTSVHPFRLVFKDGAWL
jgi:uncharacterized protein YciI